MADFVANTADNTIINQQTASYATVHNALTGSSIETASSTTNYIANVANGGGTFTIRRYFLYFATGTIPANATITSASLAFKTAADYTNADGEAATLVGATPADETLIAVADYDQIGTTSFGSVALTGGDAVHTINLNASGIAAIIIGGAGNTVVALRTSGDFSTTQPTGVNQIALNSADATTPADRPTLTVNYTTPDTAQPNGYSFII